MENGLENKEVRVRFFEKTDMNQFTRKNIKNSNFKIRQILKYQIPVCNTFIGHYILF